MMRALKKLAFVSLLAAFAVSLFADAAQAGQRRANTPIPGRLLKVREGDWVLIRTSEGLIKETATKIEVTEADPENNIEPFYLVMYTLEKFDPSTGKPIEKALEVARALDYEEEENIENARDMTARPQRRRVKIDGETVNVVVLFKEEEGGVKVEEWFSDELGIDGRVAIVISGEDMDPYTALEAVAFGGANKPLDIRKYLSKK